VAHGLSHDDAKQALVEAFVSFGRRIGAHLLAEGIERRADLAALTSLGVELGQGYLLGRPSYEPMVPRRPATLTGSKRTVAKKAAAVKKAAEVNAARRRARVPSRA
jgi:EAL domain-containing protein (putative c-di-GMP-specific phosphodiesterase class I)